MTVSALGSAFTSQLKTYGDSAGSAVIARPDRRLDAAQCGRERSDRCGLPSETAVTLQYRRSERTSLYIETQEGDVVRLRIKVRDSLEATAADAADGSSSVAVEAHSRLRVSLQIEGDLSEDELTAIRAVVEQAAALADDFFAGDLPEAFAAASALEIDGSQLARVGLKLRLREQATYSGPAPALPPPVATAPAANVGTPAVEAIEAAPVAVLPPETPETVASEPTGTESPPAPEAPPAEPPTAAAAPLSTSTAVLSQLADFLSGLLETLRSGVEDDAAPAASLDVSLKLQLFRSTLVEFAAALPAESEVPTSGVPLAAEALEALAAAEAPALTAQA